PGNGKKGAVKFSEGGQKATLTLIGRPDSDKADRPVAIAFGTGKRAPSSNVAGGIMPVGDPLTVTIVDGDDAALWVADATVNEDAGLLRFSVHLSAPVQEVVLVSYRTRESTPVSAQEGRDYERASGQLIFQPGQSSKQVPITIINDLHDEGRETFELVLSNPRKVRIADGVGVGAIINNDPLPGAWLVRFGRTVAQQVVDALQARFTVSPQEGLTVMVAGEDLTSEPMLVENEGVLSKVLGFESVTVQQMVEGSAFSFSPPTDAPARFSLWGQGVVSSFRGVQDSVVLDGNVSTALLGAEWSTQRLRAGAALSHSWGSGSYAGEGDSGDGDLSSSLTGLFPYGRYALTPRLGVWAVAGYGWGSLSLTPDGADGEYKPGANLTMAAVGMDGLLLDGGAEGLSLTTTTDLLMVKTASAKVEGLESSEGSVSRLRLGLVGARPFPLSNG
ncbi:MAG TPA: hypothetical protein DD643_01110, partial [Synechococcus sp. UBA8638]|nr:hypothetical protein [Synechococcus sp. UBA8638]